MRADLEALINDSSGLGKLYGSGFRPWYAVRFGGDPPAPLTSIADAVGTWPETATAVAVRLGNDGALEVCGPLGLSDLMRGLWRRNPRRVSLDESLARLRRHRPVDRWPGVTVLPPA